MAIDNFTVVGAGRFIQKESSFSGTGTTVEVDCDGMGHVMVLSYVYIGDHGNNDRIEIDETTDDGVIEVPSTGTITFQRPASGTSNLKFSYLIMGY